MAHRTLVRLVKRLTLKTATAPKPGLMEPVISVNGVKVRHKAKEHSTTLTVTSFKVDFHKTKQMALELTPINQVSGTKVIGLTICSMEKAKKFLKMVLPTLESLDEGKSKAKGRTRGLMAPSTTGTG
jgi:hypothetical protein